MKQKVESKFKVGDWINKDGAIWRIEGLNAKEYVLRNRCDIIIREHIHIIDSEFCLWTIQDAKDGDVLATKDGDICIFNGSITEDSHPFAHCGLTQYGFEVYDETLPFTFHSIYPATKEQCDLLFHKMKELGYEWDAKKKELKKIQQKPEPYFYCKYGGIISLCSDCKRNHKNSSFETEEITTWHVPSNSTKQCIDYIQQNPTKNPNAINEQKPREWWTEVNKILSEL